MYPVIKHTMPIILVAGIGVNLFLESRESPVYLMNREHTHKEQPQLTMGYRWNAVAASTIVSGDFYRW